MNRISVVALALTPLVTCCGHLGYPTADGHCENAAPLVVEFTHDPGYPSILLHAKVYSSGCAVVGDVSLPSSSAQLRSRAADSLVVLVESEEFRLLFSSLSAPWHFDLAGGSGVNIRIPKLGSRIIPFGHPKYQLDPMFVRFLSLADEALGKAFGKRYCEEHCRYGRFGLVVASRT